MSKTLTMADLLAAQDKKSFSVLRGQEIEGIVSEIANNEILLDLGTKSEGVLPKKDLTASQLQSLKVGDKLSVTIIALENESGQTVVTTRKQSTRGSQSVSPKWDRFERAQDDEQTLTGKGMEVNKGGLIVEVYGVRGFLPASQVALSQAANLDDLVGKDVQVIVIEVDPSQNRLIFSQKTQVSEEVKNKLSKLTVGDKVNGKVVSILPFGVFVTLSDGTEALVHISELSWEKVENPATIYSMGDEVEAKVISVDQNTGRTNLSIKQLQQDPFTEMSKNIKPDDVVKGIVVKVNNMGVFVDLDGIEGLIHSSKQEAGTLYKVGDTITCLVDSIDSPKRRVNLVPFITSTAGLIYK